MKRWLHAAVNLDKIISSGRYEVIDTINLVIDLEDIDNSVEGVSSSSNYPGTKQFIADMNDIFTTELGWIILKSSPSNRPNSPSVYSIVEIPLDDAKSVIVMVFLRTSDHRNDDSYSEFGQGHREYIKKIRDQYSKKSSSLAFTEGEVILPLLLAKGRYQESLDKLRNDSNELLTSLKVRYRKYLS